MHLAEKLYVHIFTVALAILIVGCGLTLWFETLEHGSPGPTTSLFVTAAALLGLAGLARPRIVYLGLRSRRSLQLAPAALGVVAVLVDGPESQCWWIALPLLWIVGVVSSTALAVGAAAVVTAIAFLAGTILGGQALIGPQDTGVLPAAIGLPAYTLVGRVLVDGFAGLVLQRHHLAHAVQHAPGPLPVPNLAASATATTAPVTQTPAARRPPRPVSRLTARQLEVTRLLHDGLHQTEIAACLGISVRQVQRLVAAARERVGAATTNQLVAMLASGALTSTSPPPETTENSAH